MKRLFCFVCFILILCLSFTIIACDRVDNSDIVRIHIRANSNDENDQEIKLLVRDKLVDFIGDNIADCDTSKEVLSVLENKLGEIEEIADSILEDNGYNYLSRASIDYEYFPSRDYGSVTLPADYYSALIVRLGSGTGDNWWCVAYPPLCFVGEDDNSGKVKYRSKLLEIINRYM